MQSLDNIKENVRKILIEHEETRGNDNLLIFHYWAKYCPNRDLKDALRELLYGKMYSVAKLESPESIRRCRQKFHHDKEYLPSELVVEGRRAKEAEVRRWSKE